MKEGTEILQHFKAAGMGVIKDYHDQIPLDGYLLYKDYILTYLSESTPLGPQLTLGISHVTKLEFDIDETTEAELIEVFEIHKCKATFDRSYESRGFTILFAWKGE